MKNATDSISTPVIAGGVTVLVLALVLLSPAIAASDGTQATVGTSQSETIEANSSTQSGINVSITGTNSPITAGENLSVETTLRNNGTESQWQYVRLYDGDGNEVAHDWVWLWEGQTKTTNLTWRTSTSDNTTASVTVETDDGRDTAAVNITRACDTTDADDDGLTGCEEAELGTNATNPDTDGDGLTDGEEANSTGQLADADPLRQDIYVEVDYVGIDNGSQLAAELETVQEAYAEAPVSNPDGSEGIDLHIVVDDQLDLNDTDVTLDDVSVNGSVSEQYRDHRASGYHYMVVNTENGGGGVASYGRGVTNAYAVDQGMASTFMHELGHSLGLGYDKYHGIDSREVSADTYQSVMNYNYNGELQYNDGAPFDDWEFIADGYTPKRGGGGCYNTSYWCPIA